MKSETLQNWYEEAKNDSIFAFEVIDDKKTVVEYQIKRIVRLDMDVESIDAQLSNLDDQKVKLESLKVELV